MCRKVPCSKYDVTHSQMGGKVAIALRELYGAKYRLDGCSYNEEKVGCGRNWGSLHRPGISLHSQPRASACEVIGDGADVLLAK